MKEKAGSRTLLMSVLMSSPGPIVVGLGLLAGRSSTQLADFVRRSAELLAIIVAFAVYQITNGKTPRSGEEKERLERLSNRFVGAAMCLSGCAMLLIALLGGDSEKGNVIPGLVIALLGVTANSIFWLRYGALSRETGNAILAVQSRLYRAKTLVDGCVTIALSSILLLPGSPVSAWLDRIGSVIVAVYLIHCGVTTLREHRASSDIQRS